jgi:hypothetical protein
MRTPDAVGDRMVAEARRAGRWGGSPRSPRAPHAIFSPESGSSFSARHAGGGATPLAASPGRRDSPPLLPSVSGRAAARGAPDVSDFTSGAPEVLRVGSSPLCAAPSGGFAEEAGGAGGAGAARGRRAGGTAARRGGGGGRRRGGAAGGSGAGAEGDAEQREWLRLLSQALPPPRYERGAAVVNRGSVQ